MRLVLNRPAREGEHFIDGNRPPQEIRAELHGLFETDVTACTFSTVAADAWIDQLRDEDSGRRVWTDEDDFYRRVLFFDGERDVPIGELKEPAWLCHFSLGDMYRDGAFEVAVSEKKSAGGSVQ